MFRVTFMCNDTRLGVALKGLQGIALETPQVQLVANATTVNGKVRQRVPGSSIKEQVLNHIVGNNIKKITAQEIKMFVTKLGYAPNSYASIVYRLSKNKTFKRVAPGTYEIKH